MPGLRFRPCPLPENAIDDDDALVMAWRVTTSKRGRIGLSCYLGGGATPVSPARIFNLGANEENFCRRAADGTLDVREAESILRSPRSLKHGARDQTLMFACDA